MILVYLLGFLYQACQLGENQEPLGTVINSGMFVPWSPLK